MALPGLVRVSLVAQILGLDKRTVRGHLLLAGMTPIRRPQIGSVVRDGPWYVSVEGAVKLVDLLLPGVVDARARRRARDRLRVGAALTGGSGAMCRYREVGGTPLETPAPKPPLLPPPPKFPVEAT